MKRRIERLENLAKAPQNEYLALHDQSGEHLHGNIIKLPNRNEPGTAIIDGKERSIAIDISISQMLSLNLTVAEFEELSGFKITPETLFLRRDNVRGGLEFMLEVCEQ